MQLKTKQIRGVVAILVLLLVGFFFSSIGRHDEVPQSRVERLAPRAESAAIEIESPERAMLGEIPGAPNGEVPEVAQKATKKLELAKIMAAGQSVLVNRQIRDIERLVELTEEQKQKLTSLLAGGIKYRSSMVDEVQFYEAMKEEEREISAILGPEASRIYLEEKERKAALNRREWLNDKVLRSLKGLDLSSEQLRSVEAILDETQQEMKYTGENYKDKRVADLKAGKVVKGPLDASEDLYSQTLRDLNSRLKAVLNEDQYREMIALQASPRKP